MSNTAKIVLKGVDEFSRTFSKAEDGLGGIQRTANAAGGALRAMVAPLSAGAALYALQRMVSTSLQAGNEIAKMSTRLGASTEALSEYRLVAEKAEVDFKVLTLGWQRMTRRISEAANGTGEAKDALRELWLDAKRLNELRPEQQFEALAEALSRVENPADRVRLAMKLFDSEGVALIQTMTAGAAGIREIREEARAAGMSMSLDAAKGAEEYADRVTELKAVLQGTVETLTLGLAPALITVVEAFATGAKNIGEFIDDLERIRELGDHNKQDENEAWWGKFLGVEDTLLWSLISEDWDKSKRILDSIKKELTAGSAPPKAAYVMDWSEWMVPEDVEETTDALAGLNRELTKSAVIAKDVSSAMVWEDSIDELLAYGETLHDQTKLWGLSWRELYSTGEDSGWDMSGALQESARAAGYSIESSIGGAIANTKAQLIDLGSVGRAIFGSLIGSLIQFGISAGLAAIFKAPVPLSASGFIGPPSPGKALGNASGDLFLPGRTGSSAAAAKVAGTPMSIGAMTVNLPNAYNLKDPMARRQVAVDLYDELQLLGTYRGTKK